MQALLPVDTQCDTHGSLDELQRRTALHHYQVLDTPPEPEFDDLTGLARELCGTPIALISLLDDQRYWFKSHIGLEVCEVPRGGGFCVHALASRQMLVIEDAQLDPRMQSSPLVTQPPHVRFYAGTPLITPEGVPIGTLCVLGMVPASLNAWQRNALAVLGRHVVQLLELRRRNVSLQQAIRERRAVELDLLALTSELERRVDERSQALANANAELQQRVTESAEAEERYRRVVELSPASIFIFVGETCEFANHAAIRMLGASSVDQVVGQRVFQLVHPDCHASVLSRMATLESTWHSLPHAEEKFLKVDGSTIDVEVAAAPFMYQGQRGRIVVVHDITPLKRHQAALEYQINHDTLTRLASRSQLVERLDSAIAHAGRTGEQVHVIFFDLDNFKVINDSLGHPIGDQVLCETAARMQKAMRREDTLARLGGDEFVLLVAGQSTRAIAQTILPRIKSAIARPMMIDAQEIFVTTSIGVSSFPDDGADTHLLLKRADIAMYRAKETGRNRTQFFTAEMNAKIDERLRLQNRLQRALERNELRLLYQPKVNLETGRICGAEALLRWHPPGEPPVAPDKFIGLAEETGLIVEIGDWVWRTACEQHKAWQARGLGQLDLAVNCSPRQFLDEDFVPGIARTIASTGVDASHLEIEVTEGALVADPDQAIRILVQIRELGIRLSVDDFGTGYSSLSYLKRFPLDRLKIDQSFVRDLPGDSDDAAIVRAVTSLGKSLGLKLTAEGVETREQMHFLRELGNDEAQGYLFSKPVTAAEFERLLDEDRPLCCAGS